jgi:predicted P-loop ATPase
MASTAELMKYSKPKAPEHPQRSAPSNKTEQLIIENLQKVVERSNDGDKHGQLLKAAHAAGGYVAGGMISESKAVQTLETAIRDKSNVADLKAAFKAIQDGIKAGKKEPIKKLKDLKQRKNGNATKKQTVNVTNNVTQALEYFNKKYPDAARDALADEIINAPDIDSLLIEMRLEGLKIQKTELLSFYKSDRITERDPIKEYFTQSQYKDDGYIEKMFSHLRINANDDDKSFYYDMYKKHLVGSVAQGLGEAVHRIIFILQGEKQHTGKTWFIRHHYPETLKKYCTENIEKDETLILAMFWLVNIDELDNFVSKDVDKIKKLVSSDNQTIRTMYTQTFKHKPRRAAFFGSTNKTEFLKDKEHTRWVNIPVLSINFDYKQTVNIDDVWAEAYHLYRSGFKFNLTPDEVDKLNTLGDKYRYLTEYDHYVMDYAKKSETYRATPTEFAKFIGIITGRSSPNPGHIGRALARHGFVCDNSKNRQYDVCVNRKGSPYEVNEAIRELENEKAEKYQR